MQIMTEREFNYRRLWGWNPPSPEKIPLFLPDEDPNAVSAEIVAGYFWREEAFSDIQAIGQVLDYGDHPQEYGCHGSRPTGIYGAGFIYTHRDSVEILLLWEALKKGRVYKVTGYAFERLNTGLISWGSLDMTERIFPLNFISTWCEMDKTELEKEPTLYQRIYGPIIF
ncbi:MAG: hypothetical protein A4E53_01290 [Pelotomaculum sp. PtaB.Bin104]|nr:MAG: hypothetical protein A4E53_01290 [Pelotomaculum sp. PtaB.Bin104]